MDGRPTVGTSQMYRSNNILNVSSMFKLNLLKLLRNLLDGNMPEFYRILMGPYESQHLYGTRGGRFRHPLLSCEIERRALPHQLITLFESLPSSFLVARYAPSLRLYRSELIEKQ